MNSKYLEDVGVVYPVRDLATAIYVTSLTTNDELNVRYVSELFDGARGWLKTTKNWRKDKTRIRYIDTTLVFGFFLSELICNIVYDCSN